VRLDVSLDGIPLLALKYPENDIADRACRAVQKCILREHENVAEFR
jgi:hypothetical protein